MELTTEARRHGGARCGRPAKQAGAQGHESAGERHLGRMFVARLPIRVPESPLRGAASSASAMRVLSPWLCGSVVSNLCDLGVLWVTPGREF